MIKKNIEPLYVTCRRNDSRFRRKLCLPKYNWSDLLGKKFWLCTKLLCTLSLTYHYLPKKKIWYFLGQSTQCVA